MIIEKTDSRLDLYRCADIWLDASTVAHSFIKPEFWTSNHHAMAEKYLPASEVYIAKAHSKIMGFAAVCENSLAALFVAPTEWGKGVGSKLLCCVKDSHQNLTLAVYKSNERAVGFYQRHGFFVLCEQTCSHTGETELLMSWRKD